MKNLIIGLLIILAFAGGYFFSQNYNFHIESKNNPVVTVTVEPTPHDLVGADSDEHGCKGSSGYSWCELKQKCLRVWEEPCQKQDDTLAIKKAMLTKHNWNEDEVTITISDSNESYARGGVKEKDAVGGGMFLAVKQEGVWKIIYDGNGAVDCTELKNVYQFPKSMLTGMCD